MANKVTFTDEQLNAIVSMMEKQAFYDFYNGEFDSFITGDLAIDLDITHKEAREQMILVIKQMLS